MPRCVSGLIVDMSSYFFGSATDVDAAESETPRLFMWPAMYTSCGQTPRNWCLTTTWRP
jgi:hypothetical protein